MTKPTAPFAAAIAQRDQLHSLSTDLLAALSEMMRLVDVVNTAPSYDLARALPVSAILASHDAARAAIAAAKAAGL